MMTGVTIQEVRDALANAFDFNSLEEMLDIQLEKRLWHVVPQGLPLPSTVFKLLKVAEQQGWEIKLIRGAYRYNPENPGLLRIYEKYGLAPQITLLREGQPVTGVEAGASRPGLEKTIRTDNPMVDMVKFRVRLSELEVRVCRVDRNQAAQGTGFLIGPDVILTNYHVVEGILKGQYEESALTCLFDYKKLPDGTVQEGQRVKLHPGGGILVHSPYTADEKADMPDKSLPTEKELDFALLRLERAMGSEPMAGPQSPPRGFENLPDVMPALKVDGGIMIAQHPAGEPMKLALDTKSVIGLNGNQTRVRYRTNTEGGSSGSPVFDMNWTLVALHHYGDPALNHLPLYNQGVAPLHLIRQGIVAAGHGGLLG